MGRTSGNLSRREFLGKSVAVAAGLTVVPSYTVSGLGHTAPSDKLNIAGIGIGGMGRGVIEDVAKTENIVALCDVDWNVAVERVFQTYPGAPKYKDFRVMLIVKRILMLLLWQLLTIRMPVSVWRQ
jgi:hypothetical protein